MNKSNYFAIIILVILFVISLLAYFYLPDVVPSHWDINGNVNGHSSKLLAVLLMPIMSGILFLLLYFLPRFDPLKENYKYFQKYYDGFVLTFLLFMLYMQLLIIVFGLGKTFNFGVAIIPGFFFLFFYLGVMLKHTKRNYFVGIRTPWTLNSDENWNKTHIFGSNLFIISAFIALLGLIFQKLCFFLLIIPIIISAIIIVIYSYYIYKAEKRIKKSKEKNKRG